MAERLNLDPQGIVDKVFDTDFKGYNPDQVDSMLDLVIKDYQTYEHMIADLNQRIDDLEKTNASLRAKLIEVEGAAKAREAEDTQISAVSNLDILKRLSRLEQQVFQDRNKSGEE